MTAVKGQHSGEEKAVVRRTNRAAPSPERVRPAHPLLALQRQVGNQAVAGMLAQRQEEEELQAKRDAMLQRQEEDELQAQRDASLQRQEDEEQEEEALQAKPAIGLEGGPVGAATAGRIEAARGGGQPLDPASRATMERAFDTSFADVRLHTGAEASALSREIGALAFTTGDDVFIRDDTASPDTEDGQRLLGHELTHVVQQRTMPSTGQGMRVGPAGDHYEQAADAKAAEIAAKRDSES
jgi:hypothetical protein